MTWIPLYQKGTWVKIFSGKFNDFLGFYPAPVDELKSFQVNDLKGNMVEKNVKVISLFKESFSQKIHILSYASKNNALGDNLDFGIELVKYETNVELMAKVASVISTVCFE